MNKILQDYHSANILRINSCHCRPYQSNWQIIGWLWQTSKGKFVVIKLWLRLRSKQTIPKYTKLLTQSCKLLTLGPQNSWHLSAYKKILWVILHFLSSLSKSGTVSMVLLNSPLDTAGKVQGRSREGPGKVQGRSGPTFWSNLTFTMQPGYSDF